MAGFTQLNDDLLKIWTDWLELQQAYVKFLEDCNNFYRRFVPN